MRARVTGLVACMLAIAGLGGPTSEATGLASDNVEYVKTVPIEAGLATGARLVGKYLYVAGAKSFSIYDVSNPTDPQLMSITPIGFQFANEDVDTNGKILLLSDDTGRQQLYVWDVTDKAQPVKLAEVPNLHDHTFSCVLDCAWAYGAAGTIVDLSEPASPEIAGNWYPGMQQGYGFDTTEVAPGLVLTASRVIWLLDARRDPTDPKLLAYGGTSDNRLIHSNRWPRKGKDDFFLVQGETPFSRTCNDNSGAFMTWDASRWKKTKSFAMIDEFRTENGTYTDGKPLVEAFGCTDMWFQEHPTFRNGGLVAVAFFEHGTRFLNVDDRGKIAEVGYFMPFGGSTIASYWITEDIVYAIDVQRGIDILRFTGKTGA